MEITSVTKYYLHGGTRVAMRQGEEVYYLHGDHLGSTSLTTDSSGAVVSEVRYAPYGEERWSNGESVTDFGFTSQRREGFGLYDYNARYYSPRLGRFISPDTIVPEPASSGGFNRYRYTRNNPLRYTDPSGHCVWDLCIVEGAIIGAGILLTVDYAIQVNENLNAGMSFGEAVYYENINTQELGGSMLLGAGGGAITAAAAPAVAPYAYHYADKINAFGQTPAGRITNGAIEGAAESCLENCTPENVINNAAQGAAFGAVEAASTTPNRINSARELQRRAEEPGPYHNFPESFDQEIFQGQKTVVDDNYTLYTQRGSITHAGDYTVEPPVPPRVVEGTYEIGVKPSPSGRTEVITHRFFNPDRR